ncbi:MAG: protein-L-isoaspartate(D-aspartate) O-methyltransferase [Methylocystis sp.]|nr:protein-L-isoaspartate(D-aspartate) O-methyltransferase [Methylocystis sp.]
MSAAALRAANNVEARAALLLSLRLAGVRDISVMRAIEIVPRDAYAPSRFRDLANRNVQLPIGCGQTMPRPADLARRLEALRIGRGHRVLEVGTGSGYAAAVMGQLCREVITIERFETLSIEAERRLVAQGVPNVKTLHGDGLAPKGELGHFDRIIVQASVEALPEALLERLAPRGVLLYARRLADGDGKARERLIKVDRKDGNEIAETDLGGCNLGAARSGVAQAL